MSLCLNVEGVNEAKYVGLHDDFSELDWMNYKQETGIKSTKMTR